ncbi:MAG: cysteine desulfurase NifS [candidate division WOR-3 bacterium]|nr:cysteine desulfurase NifS [candidate division WOR-3 bacterium]
MGRFIYLDHNATTPTDERVVEAMKPYFNKEYGNPSSIYKFAQEAREAKEVARDKVAKILNAKPEEIIFTSGGTEADNFAIKGIAYANKERGNHIITSKIEHHAVLNTCRWLGKQGFRVTYIGVNKYGIVDLDELKNAITDKTILITIMHANNEIGTIEPIGEIGKMLQEINKQRITNNKPRIYFHTDAVQTVGKIPIAINKLGVDLLSLSGHKFYGPKGVGALFIRKRTKINSLLHGGHHERNRRAGTENVPGIVGLAKACEIAMEEQEKEEKKLKALRNRLEKAIVEKIDDVIINGHTEKRLAGTLNICVKYVEGESMLLNLDLEGIAASSGSACTSGTLEPSHVLLALGIPPEVAHGSLRFSLGRNNTEEDIDHVIEVLPPIVKKLRAMSPFRKGREGGLRWDTQKR